MARTPGPGTATSAPRFPQLGGDGERREFHAVLAQQAAMLTSESPRLKVPAPLHLMQRRPGMHYHFRPELFVQLAGASRFRFPAGELLLQEGETVVLPTGLPHAESCVPGENGAPFRNFVVGFYASTVSMHFASETAGGRPEIDVILFFPTPDLRRIVDLAELLTRAAHSTSPHQPEVVRGLALALFGLLAELASREAPPARGESHRVFQLKWLVRDQLYNSELGVTFLARRLQCSADYLSHLFHRETGETLIHYIQRQRMRGAMEALANPVLSVSEIAWACGFSDASYFTRVFRKHTGDSPLAYRQRVAAEQTEGTGREETRWRERFVAARARADRSAVATPV